MPPANITPAQQLMDNNQEHMSNTWRYHDTDDNKLLSDNESQFSFLHQTHSQISLEILLSTMLPHTAPAADTMGGADAVPTPVDQCGKEIRAGKPLSCLKDTMLKTRIKGFLGAYLEIPYSLC